MKKMISAVVLLVSTIILAACTSKPDLIIYMPGAYISDDVLSAFRKQTGKKVGIVTFDDNETALMQATDKSNRYDIIIPSDYAIEELVKLDLIEKIDWNKLDSFDQNTGLVLELEEVLEHLKEEGFDFLEYAVPYFWGSVGFLYNHDKISESTILEQEWKIFENTSYSAVVYDSSRDALLMAFHATTQGKFNEASKTQIDAASQWLVQVTNRSNVSILGDQLLDAPGLLTQDLIQVYSGDAIYIMQENSKYSYYKPSLTNVWADGYVIPKNAKNKALAYEFIDFMLSYDQAVENSLNVGYTTPVKTAFDVLVNDDFLEYASTYAVDVDTEKDEFFRYNPTLKALLDEAWRRIRTS